MVAVRLGGDRAELWRTNLATVIASLDGNPRWRKFRPTVIPAGNLKKHHDPNLIHFVRAGDWVVFGWGRG